MHRKTRFQVVPLASIATLLSQSQEAEDKTAKRPVKILSVTFDRNLGATREMLFTQAGFQVATISTIGHAIQMCAAESFDLIVIGHSIPLQQRELLLKEVRRQCGTPILALCRHGEPPLSNADYIFDSADSPGFLLETVTEIVKSHGAKPRTVAQPTAGARQTKTAKRVTARAKSQHRSTL